MSPAGGWPQLLAAIEAGADAVYFGLDHFSARAKVGFTVEELPEVLGALHERGVMGFVTFNTLVFDDELQRAEHAILAIARAGADSIIVQDVGIAQLARTIAPYLPIHGSTQMSITSAQGAEMAKRFGCSRVVLGRELSLADIRRIRDATDMELEVFVHGALCVSYSGQCFSSEAWGGRSANRGKCAQACRLSYDLVVDGADRDLGPDRYLLSPGDLYAIEQVPELVDIGVSCLKIEGRYKDEHYVAATTLAYRRALDAAVLGQKSSDQNAERQNLEQLYSRGLGPWFMQGTNHQQVVQGRAPRHRGVLVGAVAEVFRDSIVITSQKELRAGDGVVFDAADWRSPDEPEEGGNIFSVDGIDVARKRLRIRFGNNAIDFGRIRSGDRVWRTSDPQLLIQLKPIAKRGPNADPVYTRPVSLLVTGQAGQPLVITASIENGLVASVHSQQPLAIANNQGINTETVRQQLGRLGGTPFHLDDLQVDTGTAPVFLPVSQLNKLRRDLVAKLVEQRKRHRQTTTASELHPSVGSWLIDHPSRAIDPSSNKQVELHLLVRSAQQLAAAIECRPSSITLDYLELYGLRPSVDQIRDTGIVARVASPRVLKPSEQNIVHFLISLDCAIVVRSAGLLHDLLKIPQSDRPALIGDFSLNVANFVSANSLLELGLHSITPTWDLNAEQIVQLSLRMEPARLEVIAFGHLPVFHTEHCVFCRFLSNGTDNTNCGHPCETHQISLRDKQGRLHPVMADVGCRNTVFGGEAQVSAQWLPRWIEAGLRNFRLEFVHETPEQVTAVANSFRSYFTGDLSTQLLRERLAVNSPAGTTIGSYFVPA